MRHTLRDDRRGLVLVVAMAAGALGCGSDGEPDAPSAATRRDPGPAPTFYEHAAPIFEAKCVSCHQEGGIGPFSLDDYAAASARASQIEAYTADRIMPPFLVETGGECGSFDEGVALTDEEIATIGAWARGGALEGSPVELVRPALPVLAGATDFALPEFMPQITGGPLAEFDEYRCLPVPTALDADAFVTGYDLSPGNAELVHHVIAYVVDLEHVTESGQTNQQVIDALRAADPNPERVGWSCFSSAGEGVEFESAPAVWAPGQGIVEYPEGLGVPLRRGRTLVMQVHYNMARAAPARDQTTLRLRLSPSVAREAVFLGGDDLLESLYGSAPALLAAGQRSIKFTWESSGRDMGVGDGLDAELVSFFPHMHERGRKYTFEIAQGAGSYGCQGRVNRWDFAWQRIYDYAAPIPFDANTRFRVTCDYDTSADTEPVRPGWGTQNEMCFVLLMLALPPGVSL
ncbi:MAG TPA: hypothetical protein VMG12_08205 [Polyangiaceae bacterium]|nr:hypothetical protein [Polyangiaceae bacterium]